VNIACHVKQSSKTTSFGGTLSWQWHGGMSSVRVVQTATKRILWHRFPGASETVGQVFKFVWRLHWKINDVCMSLSPLVSFKSWFVTYLLNFPRNIGFQHPQYRYISRYVRIQTTFTLCTPILVYCFRLVTVCGNSLSKLLTLRRYILLQENFLIWKVTTGTYE